MSYLENIAVLLVIVGVYYIGKLNVFGQYLMAVSQVIWFIFAIYNNLYGLAFQSVILFVLALKAIQNWNRKLGEK